MRRVFEGTDWPLNCLTEGLSTGEELIHRLRDPVFDPAEPTKVIEPGVSDKRLLAFGEEFARMLRVCQRPDNTSALSCAKHGTASGWKSLPKKTPEKATGAHVSVISHVTREDLYHEMDETMVANGFGNRFLFCCVKRSKLLPLGGRLEKRVADKLTRQVHEIIAHCPCGEIPFDPDAEALWCAQYERLTTEKMGMYGAITARGEAQVIRLALIYTLLDQAQFIGVPHLKAALEVWRYAEASARVVFGDKLGDRIADTILSALRRAGTDGMTQTAIYDLWKGRITAERINMALNKLVVHQLARHAKITTSGRPALRWYA